MSGRPASDRRQAVHDFKREQILAAARQVFADQGLEAVTMRGIADAAGYTPGALYAYYPGKEELYGDMLAASLSRLGQVIRQAIDHAETKAGRVAAGLRGFHDYYRSHPDELALGLYLFQGGRRGLTRELDRVLNGKLIAVLSHIAGAVAEAYRLDPPAANLETVGAVSQVCGILLLEASGRLKLLGFEGDALADHMIATMDARLRV